LSELDKGAFGQVYRCYDHKFGREVAVKVNRNSEADHKSSRTEVQVLKALNRAEEDHSYRNRTVTFFESFLFRSHYCLVFELLGRNVYSLLKER
jgi:dual specificity tyrosine-phosphorylation-regulated kinase 2/3/4